MRKPAMDVNHTSGKMEAGWKNNARPATNRRNAIRRAEANAEWGALYRKLSLVRAKSHGPMKNMKLSMVRTKITVRRLLLSAASLMLDVTGLLMSVLLNLCLIIN